MNCLILCQLESSAWKGNTTLGIRLTFEFKIEMAEFSCVCQVTEKERKIGKKMIFRSQAAKQCPACSGQRQGTCFNCTFNFPEDAHYHSITRQCIINTEKLRKWSKLKRTPLYFVTQDVFSPALCSLIAENP